MLHGVAALDVELGRVFEQHPQAALLRSAPGLGPVLAARVLTEIGDDPTRFATVANLRSFAGTAPSPEPFGKARWAPGPPHPEQTTRRRLPLVGVRHAHLLTADASPLRPQTCRRRPA